MTITDLTPKHLKCSATMSCPSIHRLEDGRIMIVGDDGVPEAFARDIPVGAAESAVTITEDLLSLYVSEKTDKLQAQVDACYNAIAGALLRLEQISISMPGVRLYRLEDASDILREAIAGLFGEDLIQATAETDLPKCDHPSAEQRRMKDKYEARCVVAMAEELEDTYEEAAQRGLDDWMRSALAHYRMSRVMGLEQQRILWETSVKGDPNGMAASLPTSGDRTENAPIKTSVEP